MIYLIDDKYARQNSYGWNKKKLKEYSDLIYPIWTYKEMEDESFRRNKIFKNDSLIFLHESFFNNQVTNNLKFTEIRENLDSFSSKNPNSWIIYFSGSISTRVVRNNIVYMPVSTFYQNLDTFIQKFLEGNNQIEYLLYGKDPTVEKRFRQNLILANNDIDKLDDYDLDSKNLYIKPDKHFIKNPLPKCKEITITDKAEDIDLHYYVTKWLSEEKYENIFLPICFGSTYSDLNGLRLATHIRCTQTINQTANIYIYSFLGLEDFLNNIFFNLLKTKNVSVISHKKSSFKKVVQEKRDLLNLDELPSVLEKLDLRIPEQYFDNHHIANEWGVYQMARNANLNIDEIEGFDKEKLNSIYFKWLITKNNLYEELPEEQINEQKEYTERIKGPIIIGKIDLPKSKK